MQDWMRELVEMPPDAKVCAECRWRLQVLRPLEQASLEPQPSTSAQPQFELDTSIASDPSFRSESDVLDTLDVLLSVYGKLPIKK